MLWHSHQQEGVSSADAFYHFQVITYHNIIPAKLVITIRVCKEVLRCGPHVSEKVSASLLSNISTNYIVA